MLCLSTGMIIGYFNIGTDHAQLLPSNTADAFAVFQFSLIKNSVLLLITYLNAFSLLGFPLTATTLAVNGYFMMVSTSNILLATESEKFTFLLYNIPHIALVIIANILLSERVFYFSQSLFTFIIKNGFRGSFMQDALKLTGVLAIALLIVFISAFYEGYIL